MRAHIIEVLNGNGWAKTFCGRIGEKKLTDTNSFLSETGKTFFQAFRCDDAENLNAYVNCIACQREYDVMMSRRAA